MLALIDCNNFFVSCERAIQPDLKDKPVVVLSGNDGCIIARSNEVKALGVKMGEPYFKVKNLLTRHKVHICSSNHQNYGDFSRKIMAIIGDAVPDMEIYSIDEAFIDLGNMPPEDPVRFCARLRSKILAEVDIPVSIGIAHTKTLAKIACDMAKRGPSLNDQFVERRDLSSAPIKDRLTVLDPSSPAAHFKAGPLLPSNSSLNDQFVERRDSRLHGNDTIRSGNTGIFLLKDPTQIRQILEQLDVGDIWGIGPRTSKFLRSEGNYKAAHLVDMPDHWIRSKLHITGYRTVLELRGVRCFSIETQPDSKQSITVSRSFERRITDLESLQKALSSYVARAAVSLRQEESVTDFITVYLTTGRFAQNYYSNSISIKFDEATDYTPALLAKAKEGLAKIYKPGFGYKKCGVIFHNLTTRQIRQGNLFAPKIKENDKLMDLVDEINLKFGKKTVRFAAE